MRFPIPLLPLAVSIWLECRARHPFRLLRLRFRLRTMFILVAIVALIMTGFAHSERRRELLRRSKSYTRMAYRYAKAESFHEWAASLGDYFDRDFWRRPGVQDRTTRGLRAEDSGRRRAAHAEMSP
jgi:hypothetical protein